MRVRERVFVAKLGNAEAYKRLKQGVLVRSHYRAGWYGRVLEAYQRKDGSILVTIETICTSDGRPHRKPYRMRLGAGWLELVSALPSRFSSLQERGKQWPRT